MLITYDTLVNLAVDSEQPTNLMVSKAGNILVSMSSCTFEVKHRGGMATVDLFRNITSEQAREIAAALTKAADQIDEFAKSVAFGQSVLTKMHDGSFAVTMVSGVGGGVAGTK
jgi:hypothetical protein